MELRWYQRDLVNAIRASIVKGNKRVLAVLSTGGGKTPTFSDIIAKTVNKGGKVAIFTHRDQLLKQAVKTLGAFNVECGIVKAGYTPSPFAPVQVCSIATVANRIAWLQRFNPSVIIIDEAHHTPANSYVKAIEAVNAIVIGFTATPVRTDGKGLDDVFDDMVCGISMSGLIKHGFLCRFRLYDPGEKIDLKGVKTQMGDFNKKQLAKAMEKPTLVGSAVSHYQRRGKNMPACCFCVSVKHAELVAAEFRAAGYTAEYIAGDLPQNEQKRILSDFSDGKIQILTSCDLISEGFDLPAIGVAILMRPTQSLSLYLQQVGRALRPMKGKEQAIILDHAGNYARFGHPADDFQWSLSGEVKVKKDKEASDKIAASKRCDACFAVFSPSEVKNGCCPECGEGLNATPRIIKTVAGELIEVPYDFDAVPKTAEEIAAEKEAEARRKEAEKWAVKKRIWDAKSYNDLLKIETDLGYKKGWAYYRWKNSKLSKKK